MGLDRQPLEIQEIKKQHGPSLDLEIFHHHFFIFATFFAYETSKIFCITRNVN